MEPIRNRLIKSKTSFCTENSFGKDPPVADDFCKVKYVDTVRKAESPPARSEYVPKRHTADQKFFNVTLCVIETYRIGA